MIVEVLAIVMEMTAYAMLDNSAMGSERAAGKAFSWKTCVFIIISTIYLELFNTFPIDSRMAIFVHIFSFIYCLIETMKLDRAIYAVACSAVIMIIMQLLVASPVMIIKKYIIPNDMSFAFVINLLVLLVIFIASYIYRISKELDRLYLFFKRKRYIILLILSCCIVLAYDVKLDDTFNYYLFFRFLIFFVTILGTIFLLRHEIIKNMKQEYENEQLLLYSHAYDTILKTIQARQHEFESHLNTIINMHRVCCDYDSLVKSQMEYCGGLEESYKYRRLLNTKQPVLSGFLYLKFVSYEELDAKITYFVEVEDVTLYITIIELLEVLGTLIDNAF